MRPLDRISSIKLKLVIVIVAAVVTSAVVSSIGWRTGIPLWLRPVIAVSLSLLLVYPLSRGVTAPLRQMAAAARAMARGDFSQPVTATSRDEVGDLAQSFEQMRAELGEVDRQRRELIANVAHELRTPLTVLRVRFENIVDGVEPNDAAAVAASLAEVERLSELVERVLDLSRLESGASPLHLERFDVAELLDDATAAASGVGATQIETRTEGAERGPVTHIGDRARIDQVVRNLVDNAVRHGGGGCCVLGRSTPDGLVLEVADRGTGIPPAERERVMERFSRLDDARSTSGTGLGLAIVAEIVELHGGTIAITANEPTGCRVVVALPHADQEPT